MKKDFNQPKVVEDVAVESEKLPKTDERGITSLYSKASSTTTPYYASTVTNEWYTPARYMDAVREVLGGQIELDVASCEEANKVVRAQRFYSMAENGLVQPWDSSTMFLNPPYGRINGKSQAGVWARRLLSEYTSGNVREAVLLVNASTPERWFQPLLHYPICLSNHRIRFSGENGMGSAPTKGNAFVYFGHNPNRFARVFEGRNIGTVLRHYSFANPIDDEATNPESCFPDLLEESTTGAAEAELD